MTYDPEAHASVEAELAATRAELRRIEETNLIVILILALWRLGVRLAKRICGSG